MEKNCHHRHLLLPVARSFLDYKLEQHHVDNTVSVVNCTTSHFGALRLFGMVDGSQKLKTTIQRVAGKTRRQLEAPDGAAQA
jgi:hypothetical protein